MLPFSTCFTTYPFQRLIISAGQEYCQPGIRQVLRQRAVPCTACFIQWRLFHLLCTAYNLAFINWLANTFEWTEKSEMLTYLQTPFIWHKHPLSTQSKQRGKHCGNYKLIFNLPSSCPSGTVTRSNALVIHMLPQDSILWLETKQSLRSNFF